MVFYASLACEKWLLCCLEKNCVRLHRKRAFSTSRLSKYTNGYGSKCEKNFDSNDSYGEVILQSRGRVEARDNSSMRAPSGVISIGLVSGRWRPCSLRRGAP